MHGNTQHSLSRGRQLIRLSVATFLCASVAHADFKDDVGFTQLKAEYGSALPNGSGIRVMQVEWTRDGAWAPQAAGQLSGKSFTYTSTAPTSYSTHANEVATYLAGSTSSMTPGITEFYASEATAFVGRNQLNGTRSLAPGATSWDIENHSWGGNDPLYAAQILKKEDMRIERDNIVAFVGVDNASSLSQLLANGYNSIAVGTSTGNHPQTGTTLEGSGRMKPDLVGTATWTSYATPIVASSAAILRSSSARSTAPPL
jgi:hypothetical protein